MKKPKNSRKIKNKKNTAYMQKAENNILIVNCGLIIYSLMLLLIYNMSRNTATAMGAQYILKFFTFGGIVAAMGIAAYAAYVSKRSLLKFAFMAVFVSVSSAVITGPAKATINSYIIVAAAIITAFTANIIYAIITDKALYYENKKVRIIFRTVVGVIYALFFVFLVVRYFYIMYVYIPSLV